MSTVAVNLPLNQSLNDVNLINVIRQTYLQVWTCSTSAYSGEPPFSTYGLYDNVPSLLAIIRQVEISKYEVRHNPMSVQLMIKFPSGINEGTSYYTIYSLSQDELVQFNAAFPCEHQ